MDTIEKVRSTLITDLPQFLKSTDFSKAVKVGVAVTTPIFLGLYTGHFEIGLALGFGAFWCSPSDVSGSYRHKKIGILFSAALVTLVSIIGSYLNYETWLPLPILGVVTLAIAFISVYGFRASLISFSGLLALVLSFAHDIDGMEVWQYSMLVGVGGLWYLALTIIWHYLNPKAQTEEALTETYLLTADFIQTRGELIDPSSDRNTLQDRLQTLQVSLTEHHATLREILMLSRKQSGKSNYEGRRLLIFVQLIEILETAIANPVNYMKMDELLRANPAYTSGFRDLMYEMASQLRAIASAGSNFKRLPKNKRLLDCFEKVRTAVSGYAQSDIDTDYEGLTMLQNLFEYQEKQFEKIRKIKWLLGTTNLGNEEMIDKNVAKLFIVSPDYDIKTLWRNLSFRSKIFRHSLRLAVTMMVGYAVGTLLDSQTPYWILLTIIVIMRPGYGLTKTRSKDRIIGTLIGGFLALGLVFLIQNPYVYGVLGLVSLVIALSMVQKNYKASATFVTLSVVFIYALSRPDILNVIQYRVLDTAIAAALSFVAMRVLWPAWSFTEIKQEIETSISANRNFLGQISNYYHQKGQVPITYKVSRKEAFLETSNLSSAFQRMAQEPKSKQKNLAEIYELVELNHTFLSALASLSSYIQQHPTTSASDAFQKAVSKIDHNLIKVLQSLKSSVPQGDGLETIDDSFFKEQIGQFKAGSSAKTSGSDLILTGHYQEAQLIWEQLRWLYSLSANMFKVTTSVEFD